MYYKVSYVTPPSERNELDLSLVHSRNSIEHGIQ